MSAGLASEYSDHMASEQSYMTCLLLLTRLYGDPRGRLNLGTPWQLTAAWKLSKLSREDKRIQDAQLAEEHFDSIFMKTSGFLHSSQKKYSKSSAKQQASIYSSPFESCSDPLWEDVLAWVVSNCVCMFSTGVLWNKAEVREFIRLTQVVQPLSQMVNTSGASTPSSSKESKRTGHQCSLSQAVLMQEFALNVENLKGVVYVWGSDTEGQLGISIDHQFTQVQMYPRMVTALKDQVVCEIAAGALHCVAVTVNGTCFAWGNNDQGQLGLGPEMPPVVASPVHVKAINLIKSAACGYQHSVFLTVSGNILTCGLGEGGVLGHSNSKSCSYPKTILSMTKIPFSSIVSGAFHSLALTPSGSLFVWGRGEGGQLGLDPEDLQKSGQDLFIDSPTRVQGVLSDLKIIQVASGEAHNLALTSQGKVFAWGWGSNGQLGNGFREEDFEEAGNMLSIQYNPSLIIAFNFPIKQVAAGGLFSMFLSADNEVFICGANDKKQLGLEGQNKDVAIPTRIEAFTGYPVESVACGESHCIAVAPKMVWTWGNHLDHRLGLGEMQTFSMPRPLQSLANAQVEKLSCGRMHSMALIGKVDKAGGLVSDVNFCVKAFGECKIEF
jgi:alpha-tubulin suppressor-like RCC1 family protein